MAVWMRLPSHPSSSHNSHTNASLTDLFRQDSAARIHALPVGWDWRPDPNAADAATAKLEHGGVLFLPDLAFRVEPDETGLFAAEILASSKNASYDPASQRIGGTTLDGADLQRLRALMDRFSRSAAEFVGRLLPAYGDRIQRARASFRPAEIEGRRTSWRKDDTRLHVDSFPANPVQGRRILRFFANVNPAGRPRHWRVGGDFEAVARRFAGRFSLPWPGTAVLLAALRLTKSRRTPYDALMLQLHDFMKQDAEFQERSEQQLVAFPSGSSWVAFTDQVSHAATAGQYQLEQTFLVPVSAMREEARSPLRVLERLLGRPLA